MGWRWTVGAAQRVRDATMSHELFMVLSKRDTPGSAKRRTNEMRWLELEVLVTRTGVALHVRGEVVGFRERNDLPAVPTCSQEIVI